MKDPTSESSRASASNEHSPAEQGSTKGQISTPPSEPEDCYYENGLIVFTASYHLKRGFCCNSGCRHCPFR